ncbi:hypothetical protein [Sphingobium herbicidovorans]
MSLVAFYMSMMSEIEETSQAEHQTVERTAIADYRATLREPSRPPSKGGNTGALHGHALNIGGVWYNFLALGAQKWVFASDTVAFDWAWDSLQNYRNIVRDSIRVWDRNGSPVIRGNRGSKPKLRTAQTRLPARRKEWKD